VTREGPRDIDVANLHGTVDTIPNGDRVDIPLLVQVDTVRDTPLSDDAPIITVADRNNNTVEINVWSAHPVNVDWKAGHWYVIEEIRGHIWKTEADKIQRKLVTTKETTVRHLGTTINPSPVENPPMADISIENTYDNQMNQTEDKDVANIASSGTKTASNGDAIIEEAEEGSILNEIEDEFNFQ